MPTNSVDSGLMRRGMLLLGLMTVLAGVVLFVALRRPEQDVPAEPVQPAGLAVLAAVPPAGLPGALPWASLPLLATTLPSATGWEIRYNAAVALARRGSPHLPLGVLCEMLDEDRQMRNFRATLADGRDVADEAAARRTVLGALAAVDAWHRHADAVRTVGPDSPQLQALYRAVDKLTHSPNLVVRTEAEKTRQALKHA